MKIFLKFALVVIISQVIAYNLSGFIAQKMVLTGHMYFTPDSPVLRYLRDFHLSWLIWGLPSHIFSGFLFAIALFAFRNRIHTMKFWAGSLIVAVVILFFVYIANTGGVVDQFIHADLIEIPSIFAVLIFVENFIQALLMGLLIVGLDRRFIIPKSPTLTSN